MKPRHLIHAGACAAALLAVAAGGSAQQARHNRIIELLSQNKVVLGWFAPARTPEAAEKAASDPHMDFVFMNMEQVKSYNPGEVKAFLQAMREGGDARRPHPPLMLRIPIFHDDPAAARRRVSEVLDLGVNTIVFPDMESGDEARQALDAMQKTRVYPHNPNGDLAAVFIVESEMGIANSREITRERPTVAIPGPGTLSRVYNRDMAKVEAAIQTQLASCKEFNVPCGITANASDVEKRIKEGFRVIIIYDRDYVETMKAARKAAGREQPGVIELWNQGKTAFGVFVPDAYTRETGETLAMNPLYDFLFLNLEGRYDAAAIKEIAEGLRTPKAAGRKTLIVRIPPIQGDGADAARARVKEALDLGADGVTIPHVRNVDEAKQAIGFFQDAKANVWSRDNPQGDKLAMLMIEDPGALKQARAFADLKGYSILACGIGSLTRALGGNREAAEAGTQQILAETKRAKLVNMLTTSARDVEQRVRQGFLALIAQGQNADGVIEAGRAAAGR